MKHAIAAAILLIVPAAAGAPATAMTCQTLRFSGEVRGNESFRQPIGMGLSFHVEPSGTAGAGWTFEIGPTVNGRSDTPGHIYPLTPPWRYKSRMSLDTSYATPAKDAAAAGDHDFWFLTRGQDVAKAMSIVGGLISSGGTLSEEESFRQLNAFPKGAGVFRIVSSDFTPGTDERGNVIPDAMLKDGYPSDEALAALYGSVQRIAFEVELTTPTDFVPAATLPARTARCPEPWIRQFAGHQ